MARCARERGGASRPVVAALTRCHEWDIDLAGENA